MIHSWDAAGRIPDMTVVLLDLIERDALILDEGGPTGTRRETRQPEAHA